MGSGGKQTHFSITFPDISLHSAESLLSLGKQNWFNIRLGRKSL
jgi:hypothetical protein